MQGGGFLGKLNTLLPSLASQAAPPAEGGGDVCGDFLSARYLPSHLRKINWDSHNRVDPADEYFVQSSNFQNFLLQTSKETKGGEGIPGLCL